LQWAVPQVWDVAALGHNNAINANDWNECAGYKVKALACPELNQLIVARTATDEYVSSGVLLLIGHRVLNNLPLDSLRATGIASNGAGADVDGLPCGALGHELWEDVSIDALVQQPTQPREVKEFGHFRMSLELLALSLLYFYILIAHELAILHQRLIV
jgi:hypothetical protein